MKRRLIPLVLLLTLLTGCSLLPQEKERQAAPLLQKEPESGYVFTEVLRQTVTKTVSATARVAALQTQELSFPEDAVGSVICHVRLGETVQQGQVLAELDATALREQLEDLQTELACARLELGLCRETNDIAIARAQLQLDQASAAQIEAKQQNLNAVRREAEAKLELQELTVQSLEAQEQKLLETVAQSVLRAGQSGVVTRLSSDRREISLAELNDCLFVIRDEEAADFAVGAEVTLTLGSETEQAVVCSPAEVGLPEDGCRYLHPGALAQSLSASSAGTASYEAARAENTLCIVAGALRSSDGAPCVYLLDENGLITTQNVEVGIEGDGYVEILSGLQEGQQVILSY